MRQLSRRPLPLTVCLLLLGSWLLVSIPVLGLAAIPSAWGNALAVGVALVVMAVLRHFTRDLFEKIRWIVVGLGGWLFASPFAVGYFHVDEAMWNALVVGALTMVTSVLVVALPTRQQARG